MGRIKLARIDSRLAHGKMVEIWCEAYEIKNVIIANDRTALDPIRVEVMDLTIPDGIRSVYLKVQDVNAYLDKNEGDFFLIVENSEDLEKIIDQNIQIDEVNVGIIHLSIGKKSLTEMVAVDDEDMRIFRKLEKQGAKISVKRLPEDIDSKIEF